MAEYYIFEQDTQRTDLPVIKTVAKGFDVFTFYTGNAQEDFQSPLTIEVEDDDAVLYPDAMTYLLPLFSDRLKQLLEQHGVNNIQYFKVNMIDHKTQNPVGMTYWIFNIIGVIDCIDKKHSDGEYDSILEKYDWKSFVIDPEKTEGKKIFRPYGERMLIVVDETIKEILEAADLTALQLRNTRDYDGF